MPRLLPLHAIHFALLLSLLSAPASLLADVRLPAIFSDHMVLQRDQANLIWGWADAGEKIEVHLADQRKTVTADEQGNWQVEMKPLPEGSPLEMVVEGKNRIVRSDILVGEVWICSGQSNMAFPVNNADDADLVKAAADFPQIRLISVPRVASQEPRQDFQGQWQPCSPATVGDFSAVGYFYGQILHQILDVPVGLIDNAWGGSAAEAWVRRDLLESRSEFEPLMARWAEIEQTYDHQQELEKYRQAQLEARKARQSGKPAPRVPRRPRNPLTGQKRPANLYNGVLHPIIGYGIRGVIWYQGEANSARGYEYRELFPLMIENWRNAWGQGDFAFYWVQLADFRQEVSEPTQSDWAELREAQTMTMDRVPNSGQAVIIDLGEGNDIHPRNKRDVAERLVRWALANQYGMDIPYQSPRFASMDKKGDQVIVTFDHVGGGLETFDVPEPLGFAIAGADRQFVWADAKLIGKDQIAVWSDKVSDPVAVRYGWADNPVVNVYSKAGLPLTPFRTDSWQRSATTP